MENREGREGRDVNERKVWFGGFLGGRFWQSRKARVEGRGSGKQFA
jgi:hypothetical protein